MNSQGSNNLHGSELTLLSSGELRTFSRSRQPMRTVLLVLDTSCPTLKRICVDFASYMNEVTINNQCVVYSACHILSLLRRSLKKKLST